MSPFKFQIFYVLSLFWILRLCGFAWPVLAAEQGEDFFVHFTFCSWFCGAALAAFYPQSHLFRLINSLGALGFFCIGGHHFYPFWMSLVLIIIYFFLVIEPVLRSKIIFRKWYAILGYLIMAGFGINFLRTGVIYEPLMIPVICFLIIFPLMEKSELQV